MVSLHRQRILRLPGENAAVAAAAGGLKDGGETADGVPVQAPILAHSQFERLEAEGQARGYASRLRC